MYSVERGQYWKFNIRETIEISQILKFLNLVHVEQLKYPRYQNFPKIEILKISHQLKD